MSVLKQLKVITLAVYRHVSDLILMGFPPESLKKSSTVM